MVGYCTDTQVRRGGNTVYILSEVLTLLWSNYWVYIALTLSDPTSDLVRNWFSCSAPMSEDVRHVFVCALAPLSEPARRFSSCTDFSQQIAQVVLCFSAGHGFWCEQVIIRCIREVLLVGKWQWWRVKWRWYCKVDFWGQWGWRRV
jgi:hypothetical protein